MTPTRRLLPVLGTTIAALMSFHTAFAGQPMMESKAIEEPAFVKPYEAGRGLITLEGPSGMFINPTSATLPAGASTLHFCLFFPNSEDRVIGHGAMASYGVTDWLEIGATGNYIEANRDNPAHREFVLGGLLVRVRLLKDDGWIPQLSIGGYGKYGTNILEQTTTFLAAYKRIPISEDGVVKSFGIHSSWFHDDAADRHDR